MPETKFNREQHQALYPAGVEDHFWHLARNLFVGRQLCLTRPAGRILDIGCATGITVDFLCRRGWDCYGSELGSPEILPAVKERVFVGQNAFELPAAFRESVTALLMLDVLEHLPDPAAFLGQCRTHFPNVRSWILTLPARQELWSEFDDFNGHYLRYSLRTTDDLLSRFPGHRRRGYLFHLLYFMLLAGKWAGKKRKNENPVPRFRLLHRLIAWTLLAESFLLPPFLPGSSIWATIELEGPNV